MPRPTTQGRSEVYSAHLAQGRDMGERNDCAVRAVAAATGRAYDEVHAMFKAEGRRDAKRTLTSITWKVLTQLGFRVESRYAIDFIAKYPGNHRYALKSVTTHHPDRFKNVWADGKTYLMFTPGHVLAIVNGVNHDWTRGRALRATAICEVLPA
jgi:hypothetical protein